MGGDSSHRTEGEAGRVHHHQVLRWGGLESTLTASRFFEPIRAATAEYRGPAGFTALIVSHSAGARKPKVNVPAGFRSRSQVAPDSHSSLGRGPVVSLGPLVRALTHSWLLCAQ